MGILRLPRLPPPRESFSSVPSRWRRYPVMRVSDDQPNPWAKWLKKEDVEVAQRRMARQKRAMPKGWSVSTFKYLFSRPENYGIWLCMV